MLQQSDKLLFSFINKKEMISNNQFGNSPIKNNPKRNSEERSRTPSKLSAGKAQHRGSKSLARKDEKAETQFNPLAIMEPIKEWNEGGRFYYLSRGNNHEAIRRALNLRKNLVETTNPETFLLFKWTQNSMSIKWHRLGKDCLSFNHFQFHREITNKQRLVWNMLNFCESNKLNAFSYIPTTFIIDLTTGEQDMALHAFIKFYNRNIPQSFKGEKVQSILLPRIKNIPYMSAQQLRKKSQGYFYCKPICPKTFFGSSNNYLWILKPTFMNRGRGVSLFSNLSEFQKLIWQYYQGQGLEDYQFKQGIGEMYRISALQGEQHNNGSTSQVETKQPNQPSQREEAIPEKQKLIEKNNQPIKLQTKTDASKFQSKQAETKLQSKNQQKTNNLRVMSFIVQKYIECPMLIRQRKFDIRVWALLTHNYEIFFFKEGYLRFSSHKYTSDNHKNPFIHLTNNSVQKHCNQYDEESGNQLTLSDLRDHLPSDEVFNKIQIKIREMIWLSMCSARRKININGRKECFQLFGYDFMIDQAYKTWLIEVNTNPAIDECSSVLKMLIPRMLDDMFKLTLDRLYNLRHKQNRQRYSVKGFNDEQNLWELLGDFREGVNEKTMGKKLTLVRR